MASFILFTTSDFGLKVAEYLFKNQKVEAVVTSTPKPKGRHFVVEDIDTVKLARGWGIPIIYIDKSIEIYEKINSIKVDFFLVIDFAFILRQSVLNLPARYAINIHPSLLPKYRGPSPIQFQIIDNVKKTGISIIKMNEKIDAGDVLFQLAIELESWESYNEFYKNMQEISALAFDIFMNNINSLYPITQDENLATYTRKIEKKDAYIDFANERSEVAVGKIKAFEKWPKVKIKIDEDILILLDAKVSEIKNIKPGTIRITDRDIMIGTKDGAISILKIQRSGKSAQDVKSFLIGYRKRFNDKTLVVEI